MKYLRQTFKHTAIYSAATMIGKIVGFAMLPFYAHIFQTEGYGVIGMIDASLGVLTILMAGGFQGAILRIYHERQESEKGKVLSTGVIFVWGLSICTIILPLIFSGPLSNLLLGDSKYYPLLCLALLTLAIDVAGQSASTFLIIKQKSLLYSTVNLIRLFVGLSLNIYLIIILQFGLIGVFLSSLITAIVTSLIYHIVLFKDHGWSWDSNILKSLLTFQLPLMPGQAIGFLGRQTERILVRAMVSLNALGILELAYKFAPLLNLLITVPFTRAWRTKTLEIAEDEGAPDIIAKMFTVLLFFLIFGGLLLAVSMEDMLKLLTPPSFWGATRIAQIEIATTILAGCTGYLNFGIIYSKQTKYLTYIRAVLTPLKILLAFLLIRSWGLTGAAYSALIIQILTLLWIYKKSQSFYRLSLDYGRISIIVTAAFLIFFAVDGSSFQNFGPAVFLREQLMPGFISLIGSTPLADWRSGKLIEVLQMKSETFISFIFSVLLSFSFILLIPLLWYKKVKVTVAGILTRFSRSRITD